MSVDKELIGTEFDYVTPHGIYRCFVAQADYEIGLTAKPFDPEAFLKAGFPRDDKGEINALCLSKDTTCRDAETFEGEYEFCKKWILTGKYLTRPSRGKKVHGEIGPCAF